MAHILAVHRSPTHSFSKHPQPLIHLLAGLGVEGDAHCGSTVRHRYLVRRNPAAPNRTQVHLLAAELLDDLNYPASPALTPPLQPGELGENLTTRGIDLLALPLGTCLHLGPAAVLELTGLRTPCSQLNRLQPGLMRRCILPGTRIPRAGVMAIVLRSGSVQPGCPIDVHLPDAPHHPLRPI